MTSGESAPLSLRGRELLWKIPALLDIFRRIDRCFDIERYSFSNSLRFFASMSYLMHLCLGAREFIMLMEIRSQYLKRGVLFRATLA